MTTTPLTRPTRLADGRVSPPVLLPATITRGFPAPRLAQVEAAWSPARRQLAAARQVAGGDLESSHWNWAGKDDRVARGELALVAVECEGDVQGLMAIPVQPRPALLTPGAQLVYVDYLEVAPWNQSSSQWARRFLGAGKVLIGQAIHISRELGFGGRVGLHSLPQAENFYAATCRMKRIGPDPSYFDLVYYEYSESAVASWLAAEGIP